MGKGIVYCHECGQSLREEEFTKNRAHWIENVPYCLDCRTPDPTPPTGVQPKVKARKGTDRIPHAGRRDARTQSRAPGKPPLPLPMILAVAGGLLLILILMIFVFKKGPGR